MTGTEQTAVVSYRGRRDVVFHLDNPDDTVQRPISKGRFYEAELLAAHRDLIFRGSTVLDVGANIGNHTAYYAASRAGRVYPFEPNPRARALLLRTVAANGFDGVDLSYVEHGVGARDEELRVHSPSADNLGRTFLGAEGDVVVRVRPLDDLELRGPVSLIKVDVEGMELDVLAGAEATIAAHRPALAIEVDTAHVGAFWQWVDAHDYHVLRVVRPYPANVNFVCVARGPVPA